VPVETIDSNEELKEAVDDPRALLELAAEVARALRVEEWQILSELKANTGFANWSKNTDGWDTLEEHHDPGKCAGVTIMESGKITHIILTNSNLMGGESHVASPTKSYQCDF
jgi:hypothetical protein